MAWWCLFDCSAKMFLHLLLFMVFNHGGSSKRIANKIYQPIQSTMACFKRFNGTHEIGCTSDFGGNVGVLYIPANLSDAQWAMEYGPHSPYIFAVTQALFTPELMMSAKKIGNVQGMVVFGNEEQTTPFNYSPVAKCPSHEYGIYSHSSGSEYHSYCDSDPWNPSGNSLLFESFNFPVFLIQDSESISSIKQCYDEFNVGQNGINIDWPLCTMELQSNMFGTTNSEVCLRRTKLNVVGNTNYCDPIHDFNIFGSLKPMIGNLSDSSVTIIAARSDAASMFDNISPGANTAVTGVVTLLAVAEALKRYKDEFQDIDKNVLFILFEGETWDYIGSTAITHEMSKGIFPYSLNKEQSDQISIFNFSHIDYFLEVSQLGIQQKKDVTNLYFHTDPISSADPDTEKKNKKIIEIMRETSVLTNITVNTVLDPDSYIPLPIPPASLQTFLKHVNISGGVLTDHKQKFNNRYYQSFLDDYRNVNFNSTINSTEGSDKLHIHLARTVSFIATTVYNMITNKPDIINADQELISELLVCFLRNVNCTLFREHADKLLTYKGTKNYFQPVPAKMYSSALGGQAILTNITLNLMGNFLGEIVDQDEHTCWSNTTQAIQYFYITTLGENGTCIKSTARKKSAISPAFTDPDYDWTSGKYPTWTESGWLAINARLFLKPDPAEEIGLVVGGCILTILTAIVAYWADTWAKTLFTIAPTPAQC